MKTKPMWMEGPPSLASIAILELMPATIFSGMILIRVFMSRQKTTCYRDLSGGDIENSNQATHKQLRNEGWDL